MAQGTDRRAPDVQDVTEEQRRAVVSTLAAVAERFEGEEPVAEVDDFEFVMRVGADAYSRTGLGVRGGAKGVAGIVRGLVGDVAGMSRGDLAVWLRVLVGEWGEDDNAPVIPRFPVPGPRESDESGRVPGPRREGSVSGR